jgi:hypothetical protein
MKLYLWMPDRYRTALSEAAAQEGMRVRELATLLIIGGVGFMEDVRARAVRPVSRIELERLAKVGRRHLNAMKKWRMTHPEKATGTDWYRAHKDDPAFKAKRNRLRREREGRRRAGHA